ncbi:MAG TPA: hypothetical protein VGA92_00905 [Candidatus Nitrosotenuis sp.]|jgi:hypothetical protein
MTKLNRSECSHDLESRKVDLGERKVSKMNFSHIVTLPKRFVNSPFGEIRLVKMTLLEDGSLKIIPVRQNDEPDVFSTFKP